MANVRKYVLCLIDLQEEFSESLTSDLIAGVKKEVQEAIRRSQDILIVLYKDCGPLVREIAQLLLGYPHQRTVWKYDDDGGVEVTSAMAMKPQHVRVCGVNTDCCVGDTVNTMSFRFGDYFHLKRKRIQVVRNACWTESGSKCHKATLRDMKRWPRVEVV